MVHGAAGSSVEGLTKNLWSPVKDGGDFEFSLSLKPLEPFREYLTIVSDTDLANAESAPRQKSAATTTARPRCS